MYIYQRTLLSVCVVRLGWATTGGGDNGTVTTTILVLLLFSVVVFILLSRQTRLKTEERKQKLRTKSFSWGKFLCVLNFILFADILFLNAQTINMVLSVINYVQIRVEYKNPCSHLFSFVIVTCYYSFPDCQIGSFHLSLLT